MNPHGRVVAVIRPPLRSRVILTPGDPFVELLGCGQQEVLTTHGRDKGEVGIEPCMVLSLHEELATADEWLSMCQGVGQAELLPEEADHCPKLGHGNLMGPPVLADQSGLDEFGPRDPVPAARLGSYDRLVGLSAAGPTFEPVVQRGRGKPEQPSCLGLGVHLSIENGQRHKGHCDIAR